MAVSTTRVMLMHLGFFYRVGPEIFFCACQNRPKSTKNNQLRNINYLTTDDLSLAEAKMWEMGIKVKSRVVNARDE